MQLKSNHSEIRPSINTLGLKEKQIDLLKKIPVKDALKKPSFTKDVRIVALGVLTKHWWRFLATYFRAQKRYLTNFWFGTRRFVVWFKISWHLIIIDCQQWKGNHVCLEGPQIGLCADAAFPQAILIILLNFKYISKNGYFFTIVWNVPSCGRSRGVSHYE